MPRVPRVIIEFGLGGSLHALIIRDAGDERLVWDMRHGAAVNASPPPTRIAAVPNSAEVDRFGAVDHSLLQGGSALLLGAGFDTDDYLDASDRHNRVNGVFPEGGLGVQLVAAEHEFMVGQVRGGENTAIDDLSDIKTIEWIGRVPTLPEAGSVPIVYLRVSVSDRTFGLAVTDAGQLVSIYGNVFGDVSATLPLGEPVHIVLTREGANPDTLRLYVDNILVDVASVTLTDIAHNNIATVVVGADHSDILPGWSAWLDSTHYLLGLYVTRLTADQIAAHHATLFWTDVSDDVLDRVDVVIERGIREGQNALARVAPTGTATFALNNADAPGGKAAGRWTPGHPNCQPNFRAGIPVRVSYAID